jgi:hypothetical protein
VVSWVEDVDKCASDDTVRVLLGNKVDRTEARQISEREGSDTAKELGMRCCN